MKDVYEDIRARHKRIEDSVLEDPKMIINTLVRYFGGADALWHAVNEHVLDFYEMNLFVSDDFEENINQLEHAYELAVSDVVEQEFLINEDD